MTEFIEKHWELINWPTALIAVAVFTPIAIALYVLIAKHSGDILSAAQADLERVNVSNEELAADNKILRDRGVTLLAQIAAQSERELRSDVELSEEERIVLLAASQDRMNELYRSKQISDQRISLARDRLIRFGFMAWGTEGSYAKSEGREWLDAHDLLK